MLSRSLRLLDFDSSLRRQAQLLARFDPAVVELTAFGPLARIWASPAITEKIKQALNPGPKDQLTLIGSGDFHHVSDILLEQFTQPISLIVFDNHPDWDILPPKAACGSWVSAALKKQNIKNVLLFGAGSGDLAGFSANNGDIAAFRDDRLQVYPYFCPSSTIFLRRVPPNLSYQRFQGLWSGLIQWQSLIEQDLPAFFLKTIRQLKTKQVYVSIDKDCLKKEYALTNWEEGCLELNQLLLMLKLIRENLDIVGADITGEYSQAASAGRIKSFCSKLDHPKDYTAKGVSLDQIDQTNQQTNIRIVETLIG